MDKISELMDGELPSRECKRQIDRLERDAHLSTSWDTYHRIRDALRQEAEVRSDFMRRVHECLEREPTVIAPHTRLGHRVVRYTLPMAAGIAGVAVVAWLAVSMQDTSGLRQVPGPTAIGKAVPSASGAVADYLVAHQEFSPRTAMQGVASYVRTVSADEADAAQ